MSRSIESTPRGVALWLSPQGMLPFNAQMAEAAPRPLAAAALAGHWLPWRRPWLWLSPALSVEALLPLPSGLHRNEYKAWLADLLAPALDVCAHQVLSCHRHFDGDRLLVSAIARSTLEPWITGPASQRPRGMKPWLSVCHDQLRPRWKRWALCLPHEGGQTLLRWRNGLPTDLYEHPQPGLQALAAHRAGDEGETVVLIDPLRRWPRQEALPDFVLTRSIQP